jgi:glyoxylase-like metal-dependent hydrolase (beta-lactamase superfamily II)
MARAGAVTVVNVGYRSTNYWVVSAGRSRLLVDIGWPGTLGTMKANLKRMGVPLGEIRYALATHYHPDHAGLAEELKREGVSLLVLDVQADAIPIMKAWTKPWDHYTEITGDGNVVISFDQSRQLLSQIGIAGEILHTPGHSDHCVSLLLDDGSVFTGDLPPEGAAFDNPVALATWRRLRERGARRVYPAHGPTRSIDEDTSPQSPDARLTRR